MTDSTTPAALDAERSDLIAELATARAALTVTTRDLTEDQLRQRPTASALCIGGIVKHVASTEEAWLRFIEEGPSAMSFDLPDGVTWADLMAGTASTFPQWIIDREAD